MEVKSTGNSRLFITSLVENKDEYDEVNVLITKNDADSSAIMNSLIYLYSVRFIRRLI